MRVECPLHCIKSIGHPGLIIHRGRFGFSDADDGHAGCVRDAEKIGGQVIGDLGIVEQDFDLFGAQIVLERGNVRGRRFGAVHDGDLKVDMFKLRGTRMLAGSTFIEPSPQHIKSLSRP